MRPVFPALVALVLACGPSLPPRYVVEGDVEGYGFRRYQHVLDVEVPIAGNPAEGHTATYVQRRSDGAQVVLATAFVTVYERPASVAAEVRERLDELGSYTLSTVREHRAYVWRLRGGEVPWLLWVSGRHLVKLGGPPGERVPDAILARYLRLYPSDLDRRGHAEEGATSA
ncbi:MAG: hypothetical protein AAGH15_27790, partial [Myxococcota bacterium]